MSVQHEVWQMGMELASRRAGGPPTEPAKPPETTRAPRVLVENPDSAMLWASERVLRRAGFEVSTCTGPRGWRKAFPFGRCVLLETGRCRLVEEADAVVFGLGLDGRRATDVLHALRARYPETPVCIDAPAAPSGEKDEPIRTGAPLLGPRLVSTVERLVRQRAR